MQIFLSKKIILLIIILGVLMSACQFYDGRSGRIERDLDFDWRFIKADPEGGEAIDFYDADWRLIDLPHDWSIEDLDSLSLPDSAEWNGPFYDDAVGNKSTGFTVGGTSWYRKNLRLGREYEGKKIYILFEGVYMNSDVWVNGKHIGNHPYGYTSFWYDISDAINKDGGDNLIAVRVRNEGWNSRWYSGSGIYRHVRLLAVEPFHIKP